MQGQTLFDFIFLSFHHFSVSSYYSFHLLSFYLYIFLDSKILWSRGKHCVPFRDRSLLLHCKVHSEEGSSRTKCLQENVDPNSWNKILTQMPEENLDPNACQENFDPNACKKIWTQIPAREFGPKSLHKNSNLNNCQKNFGQNAWRKIRPKCLLRKFNCFPLSAYLWWILIYSSSVQWKVRYQFQFKQSITI